MIMLALVYHVSRVSQKSFGRLHESVYKIPTPTFETV